MSRLVFLVVFALNLTACSAANRHVGSSDPSPIRIPQKIILGCENLNDYYYLLQDKKIAVVVNQTSIFSNKVHLVDSLRALHVNIEKIFAPEHGFRGTADAGASVSNQLDKKTGLPIVSLYGSKLKPTKEDLAGIDVLVFDIQDVGARFYTYISTMYYVMQACAENKVKVIILDRPNPNGYYVDGPILEPKFKSFIGIIPIPVVHGCTVGELAAMINEEGWLGDKLICELTVAKCKNYMHRMNYSLLVNPSPNIKTDRAVALYPSLCFFEGTEVSVGRGTDSPFEVIGSPYAHGYATGFTFTPKSNAGASNPPFKDRKCFGIDLRLKDFEEDSSYGRINLAYLISMYKSFDEDQSKFFHSDNFFEKLAGNDELRQQIISGLSENEIRASWADGISAYKLIRKKYLLYPDFE